MAQQQMNRSTAYHQNGINRRHFTEGLLMTIGCIAGLSWTDDATADNFAPILQNKELLHEKDAPPVGLDENALSSILSRVRAGTDNIHSVLVARQGKLVAELYHPGQDRSLYSLWATRTTFTAADCHDMRSISKSVVSLLYGILLSRGEVPDIETPVVSLYPEYPELNDPARRAIRIRHLLTMSSGLEWNEPSPIHPSTEDDQIGLFLRSTAFHYVFARDILTPPGDRFVYSGGNTAILAEIMTRAKNKSLRQIARTELFEPLSITNWEWIASIRGVPIAYAGLRLSPRDLIKIGELVLNRGKWQERQIVPESWIAQSTTPHIRAGDDDAYGFQWWTSTVEWGNQKLPVTEAIGRGGQTLSIVPDLDLVIVTTAGNYNSPAIFKTLRKLIQEIVATVAIKEPVKNQRLAPT